MNVKKRTHTQTCIHTWNKRHSHTHTHTRHTIKQHEHIYKRLSRSATVIEEHDWQMKAEGAAVAAGRVFRCSDIFTVYCWFSVVYVDVFYTAVFGMTR